MFGKSKSEKYILAVQKTNDEELCLKWKNVGESAGEQTSSTSNNFLSPTAEGKIGDEGKPRKSNSDSVKSVRVVSKRKALKFYDEDDSDEVVQTYRKSQAEQDAIKKAIERNEFLQNMLQNNEVLKELIDAMSIKSVNADDIIVKQGDAGDEMFVSKSGEFEIEIDGAQDHTFSDKRVFGELALLFNYPRAATIKAVKPGEVWVLKRNVFRKVQRKIAKHDEIEIVKFLRNVKIINKASDEKLKQIASLCERVFYQRNTDIVHQGQAGNEFFIVKSGTATASVAGKGKVESYASGSFFGERALLGSDRRQATVTAGNYGVECLVLSRIDFNQYLGTLDAFLDRSVTARKTIDTKEQSTEDRFAHLKLEDLEHVKRLGAGSFGTVTLVEHKRTKEKLALKMIDSRKIENETHKLESVYNERDIQIRCDSPFIVKLFVTLKETNFYFVMEYCPRGELYSLLCKRKYFDDPTAKFVAACVLEALIYLHYRNFLYLDLKPENILIDAAGYAKLGDFGNALKLKRGEKCFLFAGTFEYMAPEIFRNSGHDRAADYWALGILIFEMLMGKSPFFSNGDDGRTGELILMGLQPKYFGQNFDKHAKKIISGLCAMNPAKRLGYINEDPGIIRNQSWFGKLNWKDLQSKSMKSPLLSLYKR